MIALKSALSSANKRPSRLPLRESPLGSCHRDGTFVLLAGMIAEGFGGVRRVRRDTSSIPGSSTARTRKNEREVMNDETDNDKRQTNDGRSSDVSRSWTVGGPILRRSFSALTERRLPSRIALAIDLSRPSGSGANAREGAESAANVPVSGVPGRRRQTGSTARRRHGRSA